MLFSPILVLASIAGAALADPHGAAHFNRHHEIAKRDPGVLSKRFSGSRWSWYDAGLGACGEVNQASDYIVALNAAQFGGGYPGPNCFKFIQMTWEGKSVRAQIMDRCPGCPYGGLDLSKGLFQAFAGLGKGIIPDGSWEFVDGSGSAPKPPPPPPKTTKKPKPTSTYVWTPPKTTSKKRTTSPTPTPTPTPTTSKTTSKTSSTEKEEETSTSSSALPSSSSKPSVSSTPSATPTGEEDNFAKIGGVVPTGGAQQVYAANEAAVDTGRFFAAAALL